MCFPPGSLKLRAHERPLHGIRSKCGSPACATRRHLATLRRRPMVTVVDRLSRNKLVEAFLALMVRPLYAAALTASLAPAGWILLRAGRPHGSPKDVSTHRNVRSGQHGDHFVRFPESVVVPAGVSALLSTPRRAIARRRTEPLSRGRMGW
jgi:hypothetical protein